MRNIFKIILTIDIGNTNIVIGCFDGKRLCFLERFETNQRSASLEYAVIFRETFSLYGIDASAVEGGIISSVVPSVTDTVKMAAERFTGSRFLAVGPGIKTGLKLAVDNPAQQGSSADFD